MIRTLLITLLCFCGFSFTFAQEISIEPNSLSISVNGDPFQASDTIRTNDSLVFSVVLKNTGTVDIFSPIDLVIQQGTDSLSQDTLFDTVPADTLRAGGLDTLQRSYSDMVEPGEARYAPNGGGAIVVVVWPSVRNVPNVPVIDSSSINLFRDYPASLLPIENDHLVLYPNPAFKRLNLDWGVYKNKVEYVRIVNSLGQVCYQYEGKLETVDLSQLPVGQYWVQATLNKGAFIVHSFVKK